MPPKTIGFAMSGNIGLGRTHWMSPILSEWPGEAAPQFRALGLDSLATELSLNPAGSSHPTFDAALVVFGPTEPARTIDRVIESLSSANIPAVCLMQDPSP